MEDISLNIKKVLLVFLLCFMALIAYITYFEIITGPKIVSNPANKRLWAKRNEVLRGTIYDRNGVPLTKSERINTISQKREYTGGAIFAHALGYVDAKYGITGLERKYDSVLMGTEEELFAFFSSDNKKEEKVGNNMITTLDGALQRQAYELLGENRGAVVVLNPTNGEILGLVSKPSFDPNNLDENWKAINENNERPLLNRAVSGLYPPGSTFKTVTAISALENLQGIMSRRFEDNGKIIFNAKESLSNFQGEVLGNISFAEAYMHSSNVVFGTLGMELGNEKLKTTAEKFFFNRDVLGDGVVIDNSKFPTFKKNEKGNIAQSAIGQSSVLATPMEMALVSATIANKGEMMKPMMVKEIVNSKGKSIKKIEPSSNGDIISKENAKIMKDFMKGVVEEGTGAGASVEGVVVCGKTGTADHADGNQSAPHSWFIGFAPYENPQVALAVIVEEGGQGGRTAARIAGALIRTALKKQ